MTTNAARSLVWPAAIAVACTAACTSPLPPTGQVLLYVTTDAPLPSGVDGTGGLFDRLQIDLVPAGADTTCQGCSRTFAVDHETVDASELSIGIVPEPDERGIRARVRLYRSAGTISGEPRPGSTLEAVVAIPEVDEEGIVRVTISLPVDSLGAAQGWLDAPVEPESGEPPSGYVGSWWGTKEVPCNDVREGMACVPGVAFWMGDPRLDLSAVEDMDGGLERLVVVSPFLLDLTEVTVATFRASGLARYLTPGAPSDNPHEIDTGIVDCTYTSTPGDNEDLPANCISWDLAQEYCESVGKTLPTEAQLELAQSAGGLHTFPWGEDLPTCADTVFERGGECQSLGPTVAVVGSALRDRYTIAMLDVVDLAGNVSEWAADMWNREHEACWGIGVFVDPVCSQPSSIDEAGRTIRGGHYDSPEVRLRAAVRSRVFNETRAVSSLVGFRCAASVDLLTE